MKLRHIFTVALAAFALAACENEPKEQKVDPVLEVEPAEINVAAAASSTPVTISSNCPWTIQMVSGVDWIEVDTPSGGSKTAKAEDTVINLTVKANTGSTSRNCSLYVVSESSLDPIQITVTQAAVAPSLSVAPAAAIAEIPAAGGEVTFNVTSNTAWAVAVETGATADVTLSKASGNGNASVVATFAASNVTTKLSATIKFTAESFRLRNFSFETRGLFFERLDDLAAFGNVVCTRPAVFLGARRRTYRLVVRDVDIRDLDICGVRAARLLFRSPANLFKEVRVSAFEDTALTTVEDDEARCKGMQQFFVMRHDESRTIVIFECINQTLDAFHVQVVRRFVKQKHVAFVRQNLSE